MKRIKIKNIRKIIQITMLILVILAAINHQLTIFHYICPICGVTSIYQFFVSSSLWVIKLKSTLGIVIGLVVITTIILGPVLCGFICPFGTIQDLIAIIGKKIFKKDYNTFVPKKLDCSLKYLRYVMLLGAIILTASSGVMILEKINPYHAFLGMFTKNFSIVGFFIFCLIIVLSIFIYRPWCKYLCPYGALLGIFNKFKVFRVVREDNTCIECKRCSRECPVGIDIHSRKEVRSLSCISCLECVTDGVCPKTETISYTSKDINEDYFEKIEEQILK